MASSTNDPDQSSGQQLRVLLISDEAGVQQLDELLTALGHRPAWAGDACSAVRYAAEQPVDVAVVNADSHGLDVLEIVDALVRSGDCPVVAAVNDPALNLEASRLGVYAVVAGRAPAAWQGAIDRAIRRYAEYERLRAAFDRRSTIERASGILMERHGLSDRAAFEMLRAYARRNNRKILDVATAVLDGHGLLPSGLPTSSATDSVV